MFNRGNYYKQYRYGWYRICSKILGYSECNLIQVPIYMQFKLVLELMMINIIAESLIEKRK